MINDTESLSAIADLSSEDFDIFKHTLKTLLSKTFVIRGSNKDQVLYDFAIRNIILFDAWFSCIDATIVRDESLGVIAYRGGRDNRLPLNRDETCALLVFRLLYEEKRKELSLQDFPSITVFDFLQRYKAMSKDEMRKTRLADVLKKLRTHKLIDLVSDDPTDSEGIIILYPSLAVAIDRDSIDEIAASCTNNNSDENNNDKQNDQIYENNDSEEDTYLAENIDMAVNTEAAK
ncbi:MAG: hypothetical protein Ta2B_28720 [Termitinemataceae bacterium]|nr:MAG: hypothetical protein Ta2B_28720 [Termitinemataceae bacterium]